MKQLLLTLFIVCSALFCFASTSPVKDIKVIIAPNSCTVTAYGIYYDPYQMEHNVQCTQSGANCAEADSKAKDCRNQNVCRWVGCFGLTPDGSLGCRITSICDVIE